MKKNIIYIALAALTLCACSDDGNVELLYPDEPTFTGGTPVDAKLKDMYERYGIWLRYEFDEKDFTWDWNVFQKSPTYTTAAPERVIAVAELIEEGIIGQFPAEFIDKYLPVNVLLVSELKATSILDSHLANNYIALGHVGNGWDDVDKDQLKEAWLSVFVEKMLNTSWPYPTRFAAVSADGYAPKNASGAVLGYHDKTDDLVELYAILKFGRRGYQNSTGTRIYTTQLGQDFGDYAAFILFRKPSEKAAYYAKNENVRVKVELIQEYFETNFGFTIPEAKE